MTKPIANPTFNALTWNLNHGNGYAELLPHVGRFVNREYIDVFLLQELKQYRNADKAFKAQGLAIECMQPEFGISWNKERFNFVRKNEILLSDEEYWTFSRGLIVVLEDRANGQLVKFMSYHTPAHVQRKDHWKWPNIWPALKESDKKWDTIARKSKIPCCFGGDDNVDEYKGWTEPFRYLREGMRLVQPPEPTLYGRKVDDFRIRGLKVMSEGKVYQVPGDHKAHKRKFGYRDAA